MPRNPSVFRRIHPDSSQRAPLARRRTIASLVLLAFGSNAAMASEPARTEAATLPPVVVTGSPGSDLPAPIADPATASATVIDAARARGLRINTLEDLNGFVPSLRFSSTIGTGTPGFLVIRGFGAAQGSFDPVASVYIDDVPFNDYLGYAQSLFDVQRIEVLRGSQATRFGGIAHAGVVDIRSQLPGTERTASLALDLFTPRSARSVLSASTPLSDPRVRMGFSLLTERGESQFRNAVDGSRGAREIDAARMQVMLLPTERSELLFTLTEQRFSEAPGSVLVPVDRVAYNRAIAASGVQIGRHEVAQDTPGSRMADTSSQSARLRLFSDTVEWVAVASRRRFDQRYIFDLDQTPLAAPAPFGVPVGLDSGYVAGNDYLELRAQSREGGSDRITWRAGVSRYTQTVRIMYFVLLPEGIPGLAPPGTRARGSDVDGNGRNDAVFGEATVRLLDRRLGLTAGLRDEQSHRAAVFFAGAPPFGFPGSSHQVDDRQMLYRVGADWRFDSRRSIYAHVATGWQPGAINLYRLPADPATYRSTRTRTIEAGGRQLLPAGGELRASVYRTRAEDFQELLFTGPSNGYHLNVPLAAFDGFEAEARWNATRNLALSAGAGYVRARYLDYPLPTGTGRLDGRVVPNVPEWNAFATARWRDGPLRLGADLIASDGFNAVYQNPAAAPLRVSGHVLLNLSAGVEQGRWSVTGYVNNVMDRRYLLNSHLLAPGAGVPAGAPGGARVVGVQVRGRM
ncbi:MAG: TonB-dependent receptor [Betaproteobacteria bacterium]|jgi:iron complex outermembrane receptor protein|nr:TonB-dependent receptor [Betaproteobacteria bacterium]